LNKKEEYEITLDLKNKGKNPSDRTEEAMRGTMKIDTLKNKHKEIGLGDK
jgi:hypothetical protein